MGGERGGYGLRVALVATGGILQDSIFKPLLYNVFDYSDKDLEVLLSKFVGEAKLGSVGSLEAAETLHQDLAKFEGGHHMHVEEQVLDSEPGVGQPSSMYRLGDEGRESSPVKKDLGFWLAAS